MFGGEIKILKFFQEELRVPFKTSNFRTVPEVSSTRKMESWKQETGKNINSNLLNLK
jgi:hypothetical protein